MFPSSGSLTGSKLLFEKNILYMMLIICIYKIFEKQLHLSSIIIHVFVTVFFLDYSQILRYLNKIICFVSNLIKIGCFFEILKKISYINSFPPNIHKKNTQKSKKIKPNYQANMFYL